MVLDYFLEVFFIKFFINFGRFLSGWNCFRKLSNLRVHRAISAVNATVWVSERDGRGRGVSVKLGMLVVISKKGMVNEPGQRRLIFFERNGMKAWVLSLVSVASVVGRHGCVVDIGGVR